MSTAVAATGAAAPAHYPRLIEPELHPDWQRRSVRPPTWATFGHRTQFTTLRSLTQSAWREDLERYTETFGLGRVIWPMTQFLWSPQVGEVIEEIRRRGLFLFDLWSHVPGSPMFGVWSHITPPPGMVEVMDSPGANRSRAVLALEKALTRLMLAPESMIEPTETILLTQAGILIWLGVLLLPLAANTTTPALYSRFTMSVSAG